MTYFPKARNMKMKVHTMVYVWFSSDKIYNLITALKVRIVRGLRSVQNVANYFKSWSMCSRNNLCTDPRSLSFAQILEILIVIVDFHYTNLFLLPMLQILKKLAKF